MKKFLTILAVAGVMAACNNGSDETNGGDTTGKDTNSASTPVSVEKTDTIKDAKGMDSVYIHTAADGKMDTVKVAPSTTAPAKK